MRFSQFISWCVIVEALALCPWTLWLAVTRDWTLIFVTLALAAAAIALRLMVRWRYRAHYAHEFSPDRFSRTSATVGLDAGMATCAVCRKGAWRRLHQPWRWRATHPLNWR